MAQVVENLPAKGKALKFKHQYHHHLKTKQTNKKRFNCFLKVM